VSCSQFGPVALLFTLACAGSPSPASPSPDASREASSGASPPASSPPTSSPPAAQAGEAARPAPSEAPRAKVVKAEIVAKDQYYKRATISFDNPGPYTCSIASYTLTWNGGKKEIALETFSLPPRETRQRSVRIHADDGDLGKLTPESAQVDVHATCR
jgi:hypothetical protein